MKLNGKKVFTTKPFESYLYLWSPQTSIQDVKPELGRKTTFCNATPYSQGKDLVTTYVDGSDTAYVECDYCE